MKSPRAILKDSSVVNELMSFGRVFHNRAARIPNELSYAVEIDLWARWLNVGMTDRIPSLGVE